MGKYRLEEVKTTSERRKFLDMAADLYRNIPEWPRPLDQEIESIFDPAKNELLTAGEAIRWLLVDTTDDDRVVGRIAAFYNQEQAHIEAQPTGGCGFFECIHDQQAADILFDAARDWLKERGMEAMDGSINFGDRMFWWGVLAEGFTMPLFGMHYNHPYYCELFENYGFKNYFNQYTYHRTIDTGNLPDAVVNKAKRLLENPDYSFEYANLKDPDKVARDLMKVYNSGWAEFTGVKPMDFEHARKLVGTMKPIIDPNYVYFAFYKGEAIGFFINMPDLNPIVSRYKGKFGLIQKLRLMWDLKVAHRTDRLFGLVFGVASAFQGKGVEAGLIYAMERHTMQDKKRRYKELELAWVGDFNPIMMRMVEKYVVATKLKRYVTYRYLFDPAKEFTRAPMLRPSRRQAEPATEQAAE